MAANKCDCDLQGQREKIPLSCPYHLKREQLLIAHNTKQMMIFNHIGAG
jgi:hypothetical protein